MINYEEAQRIALAKLGPGLGLVEERTMEKPYGWYFMGQSLAYLSSRDSMDALIGSGGFIVERVDGRVFEFGSAYPLETWFANYEKGFKYDRYELSILEVHDHYVTIGLLTQLCMNFFPTEEEGGRVLYFRQVAHFGFMSCEADDEGAVPQAEQREYDHRYIGVLLDTLPCVFSNQSFWDAVPIFDKIDATGCCKYTLSETPPERRRDFVG